MSRRAQTLCLAAMLQHSRLVEQLATRGSAPSTEIEHALQQLFIFDHEQIEQAFGEGPALVPSLELLIEVLAKNRSGASKNVLNYTVSILHLERKLDKREDMLKVIRTRLEHASFNNQHFSASHHDLADGLAAIYQDTLSKMKYRIQVQGNMQHLSDSQTANSIRALLLSAVRAARLWRMAKGSRWQLLRHRGRYEKLAREILQELK